MTRQLHSGTCFRLFLLLLLLVVSLSRAAAAEPGTIASSLADVPIQVRSWEEADGLLVAEITGVLDYPFSRVDDALTRPASWCEFIPLVFNIKSCTHEERQDGTVLTLYVGRKFYDPPDEALRLQYRFRVQERDRARFRVDLSAAEGPHGTRDYRIELESRATADGRTAIRMHSSFRPSLRINLATTAYLATVGQHKVGFSIEGRDADGPVYVGGKRGIVERNSMRYYLALKAFLDTMHLPEENRFEARLHAWYAMTEKYPRQLHEMEMNEYLAAKREERKHQLRLQQQLAASGGCA